MEHYKPISTPLPTTLKLSIEDSTKSPIEETEMKNIPYKQVIGSIQDLVSSTKPVLCFSTGLLSRFMMNPNPKHWQALKRIHRYLKHTKHLCPTYQSTHSANTHSAAPLVHLTEPGTGPPLMDSQNPAVKIMIKGQDLHGCIMDDGSGVNVISEATCHNLSLNRWEPCPFWLWMADTRSVHPIGLIRHLDFTLGGHMLTISAVILRLEAQGAYPMLLGRPWLRTTNIKQKWQRNMISFRRGKTKV